MSDASRNGAGGLPSPSRAPTLTPWSRRGLAALGGALLALAFPPVDWNPLAWIALVPVLAAALGRGAVAALRTAWIAGFVFFLATLYWLVLTIGTYTNLSPFVSVGPLLLLCAFLALFVGVWAAGCELARRAGLDPLWVAPAWWVVLEWVRTYILGGFPWVALGYSQWRTTYLVQIAEVTGVYGVAALVVLVNVVVYTAFARWRAGEVPRTRGLLVVTGLLVALVLFGWWRLEALAARAPAGTLQVGFIQGNIPQDVKWDPAYQESTIAHYEEITAAVVAAGAELVVWPEAAAPFFLQVEGPLRERILALARRHGVWLLVGSPAYAYEGDALVLFNRVYLVTPQGEVADWYDKMELVPFGEYVPLADLLFFVHKIVEGVGDFRAGTLPVVFDTRRGAFGALVCYEAIFPGLTRRFVARGADFLVNVTNDAWFGRTSAPYQHLAMATLRAVENRVPIVRVANTGFSGMVDADGTVRWRTGLFETAWRVDTVRWTGITTVYTRFGDLFVYGCMLLLVGVVLVTAGRPPGVSMEGRQPA